VLVNRNHTASQALTPAGLLDLKHSPVQNHWIVLIDRALVLQTKHPVQIPPPAGHKGCTGLAGSNCKLAVELCQVALPQELVGIAEGSDLGASQLLRQSSWPGTLVAFHPPPRWRRIGRDQPDA